MEFQSQISSDLLSNSTKILENFCYENKKIRKYILLLTCWQAINIRLKLVRGNLVNWWSLGLYVGWNQTGFCALRCRSLSHDVHQSIIVSKCRPLVLLDGQLGCFLQLSPKCSKIITFSQITPDPINILNRL